MITNPQKNRLANFLYGKQFDTEEELAEMPDSVKIKAKEASKGIFEEYSPEQVFEGARQRRISSLESQARIEMNDSGKKMPWYKRMFFKFKR